MYITISAQKLGGNYPRSVADFVSYLEKENQDLTGEDMEHFFNQYEDKISAEEVIKGIDGNASKLKKTEPKFYSITVNPSARELQRLKNSSQELKKYTRELMNDYVAAFNREIDGRPITIDDIKYYAKIEHTRKFKGTDYQVRENQPFATRILDLKVKIRRIEQGKEMGAIEALKTEFEKLERHAPYQQDGKRIVQGMLKAGNQSHIHIIVSRKDASNRFSLSPGSKYKSSTVKMNGKTIRRGFDRDQFFEKAEKTYDRLFDYQRNFSETYRGRKMYIKSPKLYFASLMKLPANERAIAFKLMRGAGLRGIPTIPLSKAQIALKALQRLKKGLEVAVKSSSIGI